MYESKYQRYITKSQSRFAEPEEIIKSTVPMYDAKSAEYAAGIPLYSMSGRLYVDNTDNHSIVVGPTGCKKTRTTVFATVASIIEAGESALINDPKGEIYRKTAKRAEELGAKVYVLNFRNPAVSCSWNPLTKAYDYYHSGKENEAIQCINDFIDSVCAPNEECTVDRYWIDTAKTYLTALTLSLMVSVPSEYFNISNLVKLCYEENRGYLKSMLEDMDQSSTAAFGLHAVLDLEAEKTRSCIYGTLLSAISPFTQNKGLLNMLCDNSFDMAAIGDKQTLIYIIYPDEKRSINFLVNSFFTQCYEILITAASERPSERLPIRVNFLLDEFSNLPPIPCFDNRISESRSRNIRYFLFIQSFSQLQHKYSNCAETILSNCNNWLCFSSKEMEFLQKISAVCGKEVDYNGVEHDLISPFDMQHLLKEREYAEVLIIKSGLYPYVAKLPDFDYLSVFKGYEEARLSELKIKSSAKFITFKEWIDGINANRFDYPFHKNGKRKKAS